MPNPGSILSNFLFFPYHSYSYCLHPLLSPRPYHGVTIYLLFIYLFIPFSDLYPLFVSRHYICPTRKILGA